MTAPDINSLVFDAESDMRQVKDYALILHDYLSEAQAVGADRQGALCLLTCELLAMGNRLNERFDGMWGALHPDSPA